MPRRSLVRAEVVQIKKLLCDARYSQRQIARRFGTTQPTISRILSGEMWPDVPWPEGGPPDKTITKVGTGTLSANTHSDALAAEAAARLAAALSSDDDEDEAFDSMFKGEKDA